MNIASFVAGYRLGHDGHAPALYEASLEHELNDVERGTGFVGNDHDWAWHLIGWAVGQAIAQHRIGAP